MHILILQDAYPEMGRKINVLGQNRTVGCQKQAQDACPEISGYTSGNFAECNGYLTFKVPNACPERYVSNFTKLIFIGYASRLRICIWIGNQSSSIR